MQTVVAGMREAFDMPAPPGLSAKAVLLDRSGNEEFTIEGILYGDYLLYIKRLGCSAKPMLVKMCANPTDQGAIELTQQGVTDNGEFNI